jgi:acetylornithine deacetylase/succinyl-diaminopimelate desuccinylase-like protein
VIRVLGHDPTDPARALEEVLAKDQLVGIMLEAILGVTMAPTILRAGEKINVIPSVAELDVDCRVPPELGEEHVLGALREVLGEDGYDVSFHDTVTGNRSPVDTPLMDSIRSFVAREDPGAEVAPVVLPAFSDSHWWRRAFPDCVAYGFFPMSAMNAFESYALMHGPDERIPVADLGLAATFYSELIVETLR